jgi:spore maturation protein CgeB
MKIAYVALKYDYGKKERGFSFEHNNFYDALAQMPETTGAGNTLIYFPFDEIMQEVGREAMNAKLLEMIKTERPDFTFFCIFTDEIDTATLTAIKESKATTTFNWFTDDHWRFDNFGKYYCHYFDYVGTTDSQAPRKYEAIGYKNVIKTQWACNHRMYKPTGVAPEKIGARTPAEYRYDVTFVGQPHGDRKEVVAKLQAAGLSVQCWGGGWPNGRISQEGMLEVFSNSKVNLNLTKSSDMVSLKALVKVFFYRRNDQTYRLHRPGMWVDNLKSLINKNREQIKGRNFEVPGTGGFLLTGDADNLSTYYEDGKEIAIFHGIDDLIAKARYYVEHDEERERIAKAGYERTLREHTYEQRFRDIFRACGIK